MQTQRGFFGWRVAWAAFVVAIFGWGVGFYGPPVFLHVVIERTGWSLTLVSSAVTLHFLIGVLIVGNSTTLYRRFGVPLVTLAGAICLTIGIGGWALAREPYQLFTAALFSGAGWVTMGAIAMNAFVAPWFDKKRPAALSLAYNGSSLGGVLFSPLWVVLIASFGFPVAALIIGIAMIAVIAVICRRYLATTPEAMGLFPDGEQTADTGRPSDTSTPTSLRGISLYRDRAFLTLGAAMAFGLFAQIGLIAHLFSVLVTPLGAQFAGLLMGAVTLSALVGRTLTGLYLPQNMNRRYAASASYAVQILGAILLIASDGSNIPLLVTGVLLFGAGIGNATSLPPLIAQHEFAKADVQRVVSLIVAGAQTAYAFAPAAFAAAHALIPAATGIAVNSATPFYVITALFQVLAISCMLSGRHRNRIDPERTNNAQPSRRNGLPYLPVVCTRGLGRILGAVISGCRPFNRRAPHRRHVGG
ncbi:MAG: MFS transporter [Alphaproteobacteria bacterium]|nr:MFS transporter [Alphaproteobacteria bacterium]